MMKPNTLLRLVTLAALLYAPEVMAQENHQHTPPAGKPEQLGKVDFSISCSAETQKKFDRAVALLHSFWYDEALKTFTEITVTDPTCAMAYWGIAMSLYYPLWQPPDTTALKKGLAAVEQAKRFGAKTEREKAYIAAIETFYKNFETLDHRTRALAYEKAMEQVYRRYPEDQEAAVFYGLALNSTALPTDKTYSNQKAAGEILEKVFTEQPDHPGIAHYIIHSYDYPPLASQALSAARRYAKIAPSSPHALHMPSHIFIRLGLWPESIESNRAAAAAAKEHVTRTRPGAASFDELHAIDYLMYAYLQGAQDRGAKRLFDALNAMAKVDVENFAAAYAFAAVPARWTLERRRWTEAATLTLHPSSFPWNRFPWTEAIVDFARALGAARTGDTAKAQADVARLQSLHQSLVDTKQSYWADQVEILRRAAAAWLAYANGQKAEALTLMRAAADLEDATEKHPVTPGAILPARELLGDLLLELNNPTQALHEFETSLTASPNRLNGLYGAARAAELMGEMQKARHYYTQLIANCDRADSEIPALQQAKAFLAKK